MPSSNLTVFLKRGIYRVNAYAYLQTEKLVKAMISVAGSHNKIKMYTVPCKQLLNGPMVNKKNINNITKFYKQGKHVMYQPNMITKL